MLEDAAQQPVFLYIFSKQKSITIYIVDQVNICAITQFNPQTEKIKGFAMPGLERITIIQLQVYNCIVCACAKKIILTDLVIDFMDAGKERNIQRFFLIHFARYDAEHFALCEPVECPRRIHDSRKYF